MTAVQRLAMLVVLSLACALRGQDPPPLVIDADQAAKDGVVWGALIYATDKVPDGAKKEEPEDFPDLSKRLGKVFPFKNFEILGQHSQVIFREYESWVVPSKDLFLKLDSKGAAKDGGINLHLQFWQGQQVLIKTDAVLRASSPLFIGGPKWREGRLLFVLLLKEVQPETPKSKVLKLRKP